MMNTPLQKQTIWPHPFLSQMLNFNDRNQSQRQINQSSKILNHMAGYQLLPERLLTQTTMMRTLRQLRPAIQGQIRGLKITGLKNKTAKLSAAGVEDWMITISCSHFPDNSSRNAHALGDCHCVQQTKPALC